MKIRIDIDNPRGKKPILVGVWVQGFGWVLGGQHNGVLTITGKLTPDFDDVLSSPESIIQRAMRHIRGLKWPKMGDVGRKGRDDDE